MQKNDLRAKWLHKKDIKDQKIDDIVAHVVRSYNNACEALYPSLFLEEEYAFSITQNIGKSAIVLGEKQEVIYLF